MMETGLHVRARGVSRTFHGRDGAVVRAVDGVTVDIAPRSCVAFAGPSGCGKSTLLSLLGALDRPTAGEVLLDTSDIGASSGAELARLRRRIGFIFQSAPMIASLALWENVTQPLVPLGVRAAERRTIAAAALERLGLHGLANRAPEELSGGERQRAAIARAIVVRPRLLVADEPTSQLDADSARLVIEGIRSVAADGSTVLIASHDPALLRAADVVFTMAAGRIVPAA